MEIPRSRRKMPSRLAMPTTHDVLPDVLEQDLDIVFCGTAAGRASALARAYYAHPQNLFWRALHASGLTERKLDAREFPLLPLMGLGLTDLAKKVSGNDDEVDPREFDVAGLLAKIECCRPRLLAFTSKNAAKAFLQVSTVDYGLQVRTIGATRLFVLPSPSGSARGRWSLAPWRELAELRQGLR